MRPRDYLGPIQHNPHRRAAAGGARRNRRRGGRTDCPAPLDVPYAVGQTGSAGQSGTRAHQLPAVAPCPVAAHRTARDNGSAPCARNALMDHPLGIRRGLRSRCVRVRRLSPCPPSRSWFALSRLATPPRRHSGRVTRCRRARRVLPKHALPRSAGLRSIAHTVERSHRVPTFRVGILCSLSQRVITAMLQPESV